MDKVGNNKTAVIMSGGSQPLEDAFYLKKIQEADFSIAADSGLEVFLRLQIAPDLVVGDFDSLSAKAFQQMNQMKLAKQEFSEDKDKTDTELALDIAIAKGYDHVEILGGIGSRLDHTLANLYLLIYGKQHQARVSLHNPWHNIFLLTKDNPQEIAGSVGDIISLQVITEKVEGLTLKGLKWSLQNATIYQGQSIGVSNILELPPAYLSLEKGMAFVFQVVDLKSVTTGFMPNAI